MFGDEQFYPNSIKREKRETNQDEKNGPKKRKDVIPSYLLSL
jgi:hypothetical protein